ncbi:MAG: hypothetical protein U1E81_12400 [Xanthobacteraceae bacterium]
MTAEAEVLKASETSDLVMLIWEDDGVNDSMIFKGQHLLREIVSSGVAKPLRTAWVKVADHATAEALVIAHGQCDLN